MPPFLSEEKLTGNLASLVQNEAIRKIAKTLIDHWNKSELFDDVREFGIRPIDLALFYGPPGNGKTMAAQLIATKIGCPLYRVRCDSMIDAHLGATGGNVVKTLRWIAEQDEAVVLFDECESLFPNRQAATDSCSKELASAMQIFWQELDRWRTPQLFLLATNLPDRLDDALLSRLELKVEFGPPTKTQALDVVSYWAETLHEHGADEWSKQLRKKINRKPPSSFRELWQTISILVRDHIINNGENEQ